MGSVVRFPVRRRHARASSVSEACRRAASSANTSRVISDFPAPVASPTTPAQCSPGMPRGRFRHPLTVEVDSPSPSATPLVPPMASMIDPHVHAESLVMPQEIVRTVRKSQGFALCETTAIRLSHISLRLDDPSKGPSMMGALRAKYGEPASENKTQILYIAVWRPAGDQIDVTRIGFGTDFSYVLGYHPRVTSSNKGL